MATNEFKPFATGTGANVTPQNEWETLPALLTGFSSGKASSAQVNKAIRQASFIASSLAQFVSDNANLNVLDDGDIAGFNSKLKSAFAKQYLSRSNPFADIKADGNTSAAKINLNLQAFNSSGSTTTVSAPTSGVFFYVTDSGNWGVIDSVGNPLPLPIAGGGTGANTLLGARVNLGVSAFGSDSTRSTASSPNAAAYTFITNSGDWGASNNSGQIIPLAVSRGGTGDTSAAGARTNLGLKTAATRDVGVGSGQIPDMGSFQFSAVAKGYEKLPSGQIRQWGTISIPAANASTDFALDTFAIPFPNGVLNCRANGTATTTNTPCFATAEAISTTQIRLKAIAIDLSNKTITQGMAVTVAWEAIGA
ncbi:TPA: gp53-like domain-containing protein [Enterobacter roggenkampii]